MLHWNSWWVRRDNALPRVDNEPPLLPHDFAEWTPEGWLAWQCSLWNQGWQASLAWWKLYGVTVPVMQWPQLFTPVTIVPEEAPSAEPAPAQIPAVLEAGAEPPRVRATANRGRARASRPRSPAAELPPH